MISQSRNQVQKAMASFEQRLIQGINQKFAELEKNIEQELDDLYWDYHENSEILSFDEDQQDKVQQRSLSFYERLDESFISKHSVENLNFKQVVYPAKITRHSSCRLRTRVVKPQASKIMTYEDLQEVKAKQQKATQ